MAEVVHSKLRVNWLLRVVLFAFFGVGMGVYGYVDATIVYPERGRNHSKFMERNYLAAAKQSVGGATLQASVVSVDDPRPTLRRLEEDAKTPDRLSEVQKARFAWLRSLEPIGDLRPEVTTYVNESADRDPDARLAALEADLAGKNPPNPLSRRDIQIQWAIMALFLPIGLYNIGLLLWIRSRPASWEASTKTLTLPGGIAFTPAQMADFDHSRWHKFFVEVKLAESHEQKPGETVRIDLLRRTGVEEWYLEMFKERFPDEPLPGSSKGETSSEPLDMSDDLADEVERKAPSDAATVMLGNEDREADRDRSEPAKTDG